MNSYPLVSEKDIRRALLDIMADISHTRYQIARMIDISPHTLNYFLLESKKTSRITLAKIKTFIKNQKG